MIPRYFLVKLIFTPEQAVNSQSMRPIVLAAATNTNQNHRNIKHCGIKQPLVKVQTTPNLKISIYHKVDKSHLLEVKITYKK